MKRVRLLIVAMFLAVCMAGLAQQRDTLYQFSTITALMQGVYDGNTTVRDLLSYGNFGVGTFSALDGEMVMLDGVCYQITADGKVHRMGSAATTPFAAVTTFAADKVVQVMAPVSVAQLETLIDKELPTPNFFYAIKVTGVFSQLNVRSVPKQTPPYRPLTEVVKTQPVFTLQNIGGSLVGFRCPAFAAGVNVPGYHLHFISADGTAGGHVLEGKMLRGTISIDDTPTLQLMLPDTPSYRNADLSGDQSTDVQKVEKGGK